jgi:hypothetical protein
MAQGVSRGTLLWLWKTRGVALFHVEHSNVCRCPSRAWTVVARLAKTDSEHRLFHVEPAKHMHAILFAVFVFEFCFTWNITSSAPIHRLALSLEAPEPDQPILREREDVPRGTGKDSATGDASTVSIETASAALARFRVTPRSTRNAKSPTVRTSSLSVAH